MARTCAGIPPKPFVCMMRVPLQTVKRPRPLRSGPQGKSDLCVQRADWTNDHHHCQQSEKKRALMRFTGVGTDVPSRVAFAAESWIDVGMHATMVLSPLSAGPLKSGRRADQTSHKPNSSFWWCFFVFSYVAWSASIICSMKSSVVFWVFYNTARAFRLPCGTTHKLFTNELHEGPKHLPNQENRQLWLLRRDANFETLLGLDDLLSSERSCDIFLVEPCHMFQPNFCWSTYTRPSQENCSIGQKSDEAKRACDFHKCSF